MKINLPGNCHLTYCTNIHPGESWGEVEKSLRQFVPKVKQKVCAKGPMALGLRLSAEAVSELYCHPEKLSTFKQWLERQDLYVFTLNAFPYGTFHGKVIKEGVYSPDWSEEKRLEYTCQAAGVLSRLVPPGMQGSISTVPVGFKEKFRTDADIVAAVDKLIRYVAFAMDLEHEKGATIQLALEPEPACFLENTRDCLDFFNRYVWTKKNVEALIRLKGSKNSGITVETLRQYLGVCLDTCHASVMFEEPLMMAQALRKNKIPIFKVQLTAALEVREINSRKIAQLQAFAENSYLHQSSIKGVDGSIQHCLDLPEALALVNEGEELRSHFHVPVFEQSFGDLRSTQAELEAFLSSFATTQWSSHLELETYTFDVLPEALRSGSVEESISRELIWAKSKL